VLQHHPLDTDELLDRVHETLEFGERVMEDGQTVAAEYREAVQQLLATWRRSHFIHARWHAGRRSSLASAEC
jgi:hypothetical protein